MFQKTGSPRVLEVCASLAAPVGTPPVIPPVGSCPVTITFTDPTNGNQTASGQQPQRRPPLDLDRHREPPWSPGYQAGADYSFQ